MLKLWTGEAMPRSKSFVDALVRRLMTVGVPKVPGTAFASPPEFGYPKLHATVSGDGPCSPVDAVVGAGNL